MNNNMEKPIAEKSTYFKTEALKKAIDDSHIPMIKISTMILGMEQTYVSKSLRDGKISKDKLKKLCDFFGLTYEDMIITPIPKKEPEVKEIKAPSDVVNLDALILGINQLYQIEKSNNELLSQLLEQMKVSNAKVNRLENVIGQIHTNVIQIKEDEKSLSELNEKPSPA